MLFHWAREVCIILFFRGSREVTHTARLLRWCWSSAEYSFPLSPPNANQCFKRFMLYSWWSGFVNPSPVQFEPPDRTTAKAAISSDCTWKSRRRRKLQQQNSLASCVLSKERFGFEWKTMLHSQQQKQFRPEQPRVPNHIIMKFLS